MALQIAQLLYNDETGEVIVQLPKNDGTGDSQVLVLNGRVAPEVCRRDRDKPGKGEATEADDVAPANEKPKRKLLSKKSD